MTCFGRLHRFDELPAPSPRYDPHRKAYICVAATHDERLTCPPALSVSGIEWRALAIFATSASLGTCKWRQRGGNCHDTEESADSLMFNLRWCCP